MKCEKKKNSVNPFEGCSNIFKYGLFFFKVLLTKKTFSGKNCLNLAFSKVIPPCGRLK